MTEAKEDGLKLFPETGETDVKTPETTKFIPENENTNGLSPIGVDSVKVPFTGLTKEELMKYANDPFWVRMRWFLFVLFWIIWLSMLFGAIFIIVLTPKCPEESPPNWWKSSPLYIIDVALLSENNPPPVDKNDSVIGILRNRIDHLKDSGIESLLLKNILQTNRGAYEEVTNFKNVNYYLESIDKFRTDVIEYAKSKGIHVILSFVPNHSGKGEDFYHRDRLDFYVWFPATYTEKPTVLPNNWVSVYNNTAWEWYDERKQFYLHQFKKEQPDFNFWNPAVIKFFNDVFEFWFNMGVVNFHLDKAEFLVEDKNFTNETNGREPGFNMYDYGFYNHFHTCDLPETQGILHGWSQLVKNRSGFFGVSGGVREKLFIADLITKPVKLRPHFNATELSSTIDARKASININNVWEWKCPPDSDVEFYPPDEIDGLTVVAFLIPGTPVLKYGEEFNASTGNLYVVKNFEKVEKNSSNRLDMIKKLVHLRSEPSFVFGDYNSTVLDSNVFTFTRTKKGSPGYLVAWNLSKNVTVVDFQVLSVIPDNLVVVLKSGPSLNATYALKQSVSSSQISIPPMVTYVFRFVLN